MTTEKITILGPVEVIYENHTGDNIDLTQLEEQVQAGDKEGNLYWQGMIIPIGTWKLIDYKQIATDLYNALKAEVYNTAPLAASALAMDKYEQVNQQV